MPNARPPSGADRSVVSRLVRAPVLGCLAAAVLVVATLLSLPDGAIHVIALDVGQGDAILVTAPDGDDDAR